MRLLIEVTPKGVVLSVLLLVINASAIKPQDAVCVGGHCISSVVCLLVIWLLVRQISRQQDQIAASAIAEGCIPTLPSYAHVTYVSGLTTLPCLFFDRSSRVQDAQQNTSPVR